MKDRSTHFARFLKLALAAEVILMESIYWFLSAALLFVMLSTPWWWTRLTEWL